MAWLPESSRFTPSHSLTKRIIVLGSPELLSGWILELCKNGEAPLLDAWIFRSYIEAPEAADIAPKRCRRTLNTTGVAARGGEMHCRPSPWITLLRHKARMPVH